MSLSTDGPWLTVESLQATLQKELAILREELKQDFEQAMQFQSPGSPSQGACMAASSSAPRAALRAAAATRRPSGFLLQPQSTAWSLPAQPVTPMCHSCPSSSISIADQEEVEDYGFGEDGLRQSTDNPWRFRWARGYDMAAQLKLEEDRRTSRDSFMALIQRPLPVPLSRTARCRTRDACKQYLRVSATRLSAARSSIMRPTGSAVSMSSAVLRRVSTANSSEDNVFALSADGTSRSFEQEDVLGSVVDPRSEGNSARWSEHVLQQPGRLEAWCEEAGQATISCRAALRGFVRGSDFDYVFGALVIANAAVLGIEADWAARNVSEDSPAVFRVLELSFFLLFLLELSLRLWAHGREFVSKKDVKWNLFDSFLVFSQFVEEVAELASSATSDGAESENNATSSGLGIIRILRILRLIRVMRLMRVLRLIGELRTLVMSIWSSLRSLVWAVLLLFVMMYVVGVYLTQLVLHRRLDEGGRRDVSDELIDHWGSLGDSIWSLYMSVTGGVDWGDVAGPLMDEISILIGPCFMLYIAFSLLCMLNVITGVFVESALMTAKTDKDMYMVNHARQLFMKTDADKSGSISWDEFSGMLEDDEMKEVFKCIDMDTSEAEGLFKLLDMNATGTIDVDEFINGCNRLRGPAKSLELTMLMRETQKLSDKFVRHARLVDRQLKVVVQALPMLLHLPPRGPEGSTEIVSPKHSQPSASQGNSPTHQHPPSLGLLQPPAPRRSSVLGCSEEV